MVKRSGVDKTLIIGLDCADPVLLFDRFYDDLPNLRALSERGVYGVMRSCIPPITVPAWTCMASSKDPGQLGIYGFRNRADWSYDKLMIATSLAVKEPRLWDILGRSGRRSFVLGVPQTYPPSPINGRMVSCFLTPGVDSDYTYPRELKDQIASLVGEYMIDVKGFRTDDKAWLLEQIRKMTEQRFALARHFVDHCDWDLFWMVDMSLDRLHHGFWQFMDTSHHRYVPGNPFEHTIRDFYRFVDEQIGSLLGAVDLDTTAVWVVSDHGAKCMKGGVCFNDWLIEQGYLTLRDDLTGPTRFADVNIDWSATRAWGEGGYYGRCFVNVAGREPEGQVQAGDYNDFCDELAGKLQAMTDPNGRAMGTQVYRPERLYKTVRGTPPDLLVLFGNLDWRSVGTVGTGGVYTFENDTGPDDANHCIDGMFICADPRLAERAERREISLYDVAPTVLSQMSVAVPEDMIGRDILARA